MPTTWFEGNPVRRVSGNALFGLPIPLDETVVWDDATTTHTEATVAGASWTQGTPQAGAAVHILFGGIILNQLVFEEAASTTFTESTVPSTTFVEATV